MSDVADTCFESSIAGDWYDDLCKEVEYSCGFCDSVHRTISELEGKIREAYAKTASSMKGLYDTKEISNRWLAMWLLSEQILSESTFLKELNQICGADLSEIQKYRDAALERFRLHCGASV
jgi:hypothetical protein